MNIGANGIAVIKHFEQCRLVAFKPIPTDPWTIGWGRAHGVNEGDVITQEEADAMLADDLQRFERAVYHGVSIEVTQNQFDAMVSLTYNIGSGAFMSSTLRELLVKGSDPVEVADQFPRWNKSAGKVLAGLTRRREAERDLFLTPDTEAFSI